VLVEGRKRMPQSVVHHLVAGERLESPETFQLASPYDGRVLADVAVATDDQVAYALEVAQAAADAAAASPAYERADRLRRLADAVRQRRQELAQLIMADIGKPIRDARFEVDRAAEVADLTAAAVLMQAGTIVPMDSSSSASGNLGFEVRVPAGVVVAIAPFNAPLNLGFSKLVAALGAGCTVVLKTPPQGPRALDFVASLLPEAGWPDGFVGILHGGVEPARTLVSSAIPRVITFTGSVNAGRSIAREAGLKRLILELGSNAPTIVCSDGDVQDAAERLTRGAFGSAGQACISTQRILVHRSRYDELISELVPAIKRLVTGDPASEQTDIGPVIDATTAKRVRDWTTEALDGGARLLCGALPEADETVIPPILLADVAADARICLDEAFAPLALVRPFDTDQEAIGIANETPYGLQAGVFTESLDRAWKFAEGLTFGGIQVNETSRVRSDLHSFGGFKQSGIGREGVLHALESMSEVRFVGIRRTARF
jgi:acyl-CoA reductase-like NAD-dependent aldehyde dehydrogenase